MRAVTYVRSFIRSISDALIKGEHVVRIIFLAFVLTYFSICFFKQAKADHAIGLSASFRHRRFGVSGLC